MIMRKIRRDIIDAYVGEVNVIITYIIAQAFAYTKYIVQLFLHLIYRNFTTNFQTM